MSVVEMFFLGVVAMAVGIIFLAIGLALIIYDRSWQSGLVSEDLRLRNAEHYLRFVKEDLERKYGIKITEVKDEKLHC